MAEVDVEILRVLDGWIGLFCAHSFDVTIRSTEVNRVSPNLNSILEAAQALNDTDRQELRRLLDERATPQSQPTKQAQLRQQLVAEGVLSHVLPRGKDRERFRHWRPVPIKGKPLSETIIEERR